MTKPKILRIGEIKYAHQAWEEILDIAQVIQCTSKTRLEFLNDLKSKYNDITCITRTYYSVQETGLFDEEIAAALPRTVRTISHTGAGYDQVHVDAFSKRSIQVSNITEPVEGPTALTAVYLALACIRNFQQGHEYLMTGKWQSSYFGLVPIGREPSELNVGILGMGGIGRATRDRLLPFGFQQITYHNRNRLSPELEGDAEYVSLSELFSKSDVIIVSLPLNEKTRHIINKDAFREMKEGVVIVNTGRGPLIDEAELLEALKLGKVGSFGGDVWEHEPDVPVELRELPQVVSLPHMGTFLLTAGKELEEWVVDNVRSYLTTGKVKTIVPEQKDLEF